MKRDVWATLREWVKIYLRNLFSRVPRKRDAALTAGISDEQLVTHERKTGEFFHKPIRRFFGLGPMPDHMARFIEEDEKYHNSRSTPRPVPPPESPPPLPPRRYVESDTWRV